MNVYAAPVQDLIDELGRLPGIGAVVLTDRQFGAWALDVWPAWADAVLAGAS